MRDFWKRLQGRFENWVYANRMPVPTGIAFPGLATTDEDLAMSASDEVTRALLEARGDYHSKVPMLPPHWRMAYTLVKLDLEVNNGGFHQFFTNAGGIYDQFLLEDLGTLGETPYRKIITAAFLDYQKLDYTGQWENRGKSWDYFTDGYKDGRFRRQEELFFQSKPSLVALVGKYVRRNFDQYKRH